MKLTAKGPKNWCLEDKLVLSRCPILRYFKAFWLLVLVKDIGVHDIQSAKFGWIPRFCRTCALYSMSSWRNRWGLGCSAEGDHDLNVESFGGPRFWKMSTQNQSYLWDVSFVPSMPLAHEGYFGLFGIDSAPSPLQDSRCWVSIVKWNGSLTWRTPKSWMKYVPWKSAYQLFQEWFLPFRWWWTLI